MRAQATTHGKVVCDGKACSHVRCTVQQPDTDHHGAHEETEKGGPSLCIGVKIYIPRPKYNLANETAIPIAKRENVTVTSDYHTAPQKTPLNDQPKTKSIEDSPHETVPSVAALLEDKTNSLAVNSFHLIVTPVGGSPTLATYNQPGQGTSFTAVPFHDPPQGDRTATLTPLYRPFIFLPDPGGTDYSTTTTAAAEEEDEYNMQLSQYITAESIEANVEPQQET